MNRRWLAALLITTGLACGASVLAPALAQDNANPNSAGDSAQKIDKAIQAYQNRSVQDLEQTRKDLDRLRRELRELIELRLDMAISAAELRANVANSWNPRGSSSFAGYPGSAENQAVEKSEKDRQSQEAATLNQELRQVQELLRSELQQARTQADQLVAQLRDLRAQQRQRQEQIKAEQERNRERENKPQGDRSEEKK
jgi:TolA-binding protein